MGTPLGRIPMTFLCAECGCELQLNVECDVRLKAEHDCKTKRWSVEAESQEEFRLHSIKFEEEK